MGVDVPGTDPPTAETKSLAEARVWEPEFIAIPGIADEKPQSESRMGGGAFCDAQSADVTD